MYIDIFTTWDLHWKCLRFQLCLYTLFRLLPRGRHIVSKVLFWFGGTFTQGRLALLCCCYININPITIANWHQAYTFWSVFESFFFNFIRFWNFIKDKLQFMEYAESANTYFSYTMRLLYWFYPHFITMSVYFLHITHRTIKSFDYKHWTKLYQNKIRYTKIRYVIPK